ncbi:ethanolamine utilization microcompartment protein EutS [Brooklawnia cerclae]|uniref:Ethanolamine utilization protein EutS n=1 Tax=Brooklawnia cerclae TaxID=349934 RepID=A0ABX0SCP4_9ACTN|nr:ethanolamine utilization microcompartment protein EutS [Brooklawnia cerclae]NIH55694.1 ethanolamine utilization protein EutS [Brooklawnia cerclae]
MAEKQRIIQEFVPGKQVTLAHVVANPDERLYGKVGLPSGGGAIGVLTITPSEAAIIAADIATKASDVELGFVDRFSGSLIVLGRLADVETAVKSVVDGLCDGLGFARPPVTKS